MKKANTKANFSNRIGFVLAAAGSAVGMGNLWRFPYLAAKYGGGIFLLVYLILAVTFGFSLMITEIAIGRKTGKSPLYAYKELHPKFGFLGIASSSVPIIIFPYYCVIGGWVIKYLSIYVTGQAQEAANDAYFGSFISNTGAPILCLFVFLFLTAAVVMFGVEKGIERGSRVMMPFLVILAVGISIYSLTLDGAIDGLIYYVKPDFSQFSIKTIIAAMGQLFYSMSLAMGIMITYGSYMRKEDDLEASVRHIEIFDTAIAFLAGMMIIPAVFVFSGGSREALGQGPTLMFVMLPKVFYAMPGGRIIGFVFFVLVLFAALTSAISLMETIVSIFMEKLHLGRKPVCVAIFAASFLLALPSTLGYGVLSHVTIFGYQILDFFDFVSNNIVMPVVALLTAILVGYAVRPETIIDEVEQNGVFRSKKLYIYMIRFVVPLCMVIILLSSLLGIV